VIRFVTPAQLRAARRQVEGDENHWRDEIKRFAEQLGYLVYFTLRSKGSPKGFPDLVICTPSDWPGTPLLLVAELKRHGKRPTAVQRAWIAALDTVAQTVNAAVGYPLVSVNLWIVPRDVEDACAFLWARRQRPSTNAPKE
jgi:hypothetical protein